jgi:hypothetical protein
MFVVDESRVVHLAEICLSLNADGEILPATDGPGQRRSIPKLKPASCFNPNKKACISRKRNEQGICYEANKVD